MISQLLRKKKERLRSWWGPDKTTVAECEVDLRVGGRIYIVTPASEEMGKYAGTRWPMDGTFSRIEELRGLIGPKAKLAALA